MTSHFMTSDFETSDNDRDAARLRSDLAAADRFRFEPPAPRQHRLAAAFAALRHRAAMTSPSRG